MKKRILSLAVVGMLLFCTAATSFGADSASEDDVTAVKSFTLQEAIDYALENNSAIGISETAIEKAEVAFDEAKKGYKDAKVTTSGILITTTSQMLLAKEGYYRDLAEMGVVLAEKGKGIAIEGIKFSVESSYFGVLHAQEKYGIQESTLITAKQNLDSINKKYELGMASPLEAMNFEIAYSQAELGFKSAQRALEYAKMSFNKAIGLPLDTKVELIDELTIEPPEEVNLEEKVIQAMENRMEIISAQKQYELDKMNYDIISSTFIGTYDYQNAKYTLKSSEYTLEDTKVTIELSVRKAYMDMMDAYEALTILDTTIVQVEKVYIATKTRYDLGMATENEVIEALNQAKALKLQRSQAALGYRLAKKQFELSYGIGLGY